tara:strand:+ start:492 stop:665 length:174 start_codon:yes stop_codon:yes gene_type:complete
LKYFTIACRDNDDNFCEICEYAERSDEAIKNAINDIPILIKIITIYLDAPMRAMWIG